MGRLREPQIKAMIINHLLENHAIKAGGVIISEFTVENSARRVDLAVVYDNHLEAFEIKSEADSLIRLEGQIATYLECFDKVTIVSAKKHIKNVTNSTESKVGIWMAEEGKLKKIRRGRKREVKKKDSILKLMTAAELRKLSTSLKIPSNSSRRKDLEQALHVANAKILRQAAAKNITMRYIKNYTTFLRITNNRNITANDLPLLSQSKKAPSGKEETSIEDLALCLDCALS